MTKKFLKRIIIITIVINMLISNSLITFASPLPTDFYKTSPYASEAVKYLFTSNTIKTQNNEAVIFKPTSYINRVDMIKFVDYVIHIGPISMDDANGIYVENRRMIPFTDVDGGWEGAFVGAAFRKQIVKGANLFRPYDNISREEVAAIFMRMMAYESNNEQLEQVANYDKLNALKDKNNISSWAKGAVEIMLETGIMNGVGNQNFNPKGNATKEQIFVMLYRYIQNRQEILDKYNKMVYEAPENFNGFITLGMTPLQVQQLLGEGNYRNNVIPDGYVSKIDGSEIVFGNTDKGFGVIAWRNNGFLNVKIGRRNPAAIPFTVSSSKEDVIKAMGTPQYTYSSTWDFDEGTVVIEEWIYNWAGKAKCTVNFRNGKVVGWENNSTKDLKVLIGNKNDTSDGFTIGDTVDDVVKAMGTPDSYYKANHRPIIADLNLKYITYLTIKYGESKIYFDKDYKVYSWVSTGNLNLKTIPIDPQAPPLTYGSTMGDVFKTMGTPDRYLPSSDGKASFYYGDSYVSFDSDEITGKIYRWVNKGNLKISMGEKDPEAPALKIGSSFEDVIRTQGTPTTFYGFNNIFYGGSQVEFRDNKLISANNSRGIDQEQQERNFLKLTEYWKSPSHETFTIGATLEEVTKSLGNPDQISKSKEINKMYRYGSTMLYFDSNDILRSYVYNFNTTELNIGAIKNGAPPVTAGMSKQGVIDAMGTPRSLILSDFHGSSLFYDNTYKEVWIYENKNIFFNDEGNVGEIK